MLGVEAPCLRTVKRLPNIKKMLEAFHAPISGFIPRVEVSLPSEAVWNLLPPQVRSSLFELAKKTKFHLCRHVLVTIILLVIINLLVIFIPSMKDIFGVVGMVLRSLYGVQKLFVGHAFQ